MDFSILTKQNFEMYAMKMYNNPQCDTIEEFQEDMNRVKYIKRLLGRYHSKGLLKERLILNHIIILNNVFGPKACCRILFFKIDDKFHSYLKSFLDYLQYIPHTIPEISFDEIPTDHILNRILKEMK